MSQDIPAGAVLLIGGTGEARRLASILHEAGTPFLSSLAGAVSDPRLPLGQIRIGGFGGVDGLTDYLRVHRIGAVVDATHPFATSITQNAAAACATTGTPLLRLHRPSWSERPGASRWTWVDGYPAAAEELSRADGPIFLTTGRNTLRHFVDHPPLAAAQILVRLVEPPDLDLPAGWTVLRARGPFTHQDEVDLMRTHRITALATKDSGGDLTAAKLDAADHLDVRVVIVRRPALPAAVEVVDQVDAAHQWIRRTTGSRATGR
ncbi:cobalt-precorrin-6A reductase [Austwickia chelonae]|uniref:Precorrin-6X reductase n=1 Tax=Austwickia chelonae NBRC 105200 TaxID=1184607 RepID=K6UM90_9MICO|nr:cobalt-precorrin-6A reductase [Austwickia chelonae]GAB77906.1 precorrin-6X reductase [Austwickia chelonae NBRC 105200]